MILDQKKREPSSADPAVTVVTFDPLNDLLRESVGVSSGALLNLTPEGVGFSAQWYASYATRREALAHRWGARYR